MSLLLEALKKAEKAKEEAQKRAEAGEPDPEATLTPTRPVMTKDQLPEIPRQSLEIVSEELQLAPDPEPAAVPEPASAPRPARQQPQARAAADPQSAERSAARKVFEVKFKEPDPRLPFYITMGALGAFAVGTVVYFYIQLRPPPPLVNLDPPGQPQAATAAAPTFSPAARPATPAQTASAIPGLPGGAPAPSAPAPSAPAMTPPAAAAIPAPREAGPAVPRAAQAEPRRIRPAAPPVAEAEPAAALAASRPAPQVHPRIEAGYAAYQANDLASAQREYEQALAEEPSSRDALLGLAALDVRAGRFESAEARYLRLLQADPRDAYAQSALVALRGGRQDPQVAESRVKSLLAANPGAHVLNFTLGNQFAQQGRWAEAQQQFFKAASAEPDNPDFVYNLAVSLDQLRQPRLALEHYQRAIALAERRGAGFDVAAARARAAQLAR